MQTAKALRLKGKGFNPCALKDKSNGVDRCWAFIVMESK